MHGMLLGEINEELELSIMSWLYQEHFCCPELHGLLKVILMPRAVLLVAELTDSRLWTWLSSCKKKASNNTLNTYCAIAVQQDTGNTSTCSVRQTWVLRCKPRSVLDAPGVQHDNTTPYHMGTWGAGYFVHADRPSSQYCCLPFRDECVYCCWSVSCPSRLSISDRMYCLWVLRSCPPVSTVILPGCTMELPVSTAMQTLCFLFKPF